VTGNKPTTNKIKSASRRVGARIRSFVELELNVIRELAGNGKLKTDERVKCNKGRQRAEPKGALCVFAEGRCGRNKRNIIQDKETGKQGEKKKGEETIQGIGANGKVGCGNVIESKV